MEVTIKFDPEDSQDALDTMIKLCAETIKLEKTFGDFGIEADIERRKIKQEIISVVDHAIELNGFMLSHPALDEMQDKTAEIAHLRRRIAELTHELEIMAMEDGNYEDYN